VAATSLPHRYHIAATLNGRGCCGRIWLVEGHIRWWRGAYAGRGAHTLAEGHIRLSEGRIQWRRGAYACRRGTYTYLRGAYACRRGAYACLRGTYACRRGAYGWLRGAYACPRGTKVCTRGVHSCLRESGRIRLQYVTSEIDPYTCLNRSE
jgi:hypothetical protein